MDWNFLDKILTIKILVINGDLGFGVSVKSIKFSVLINGNPKGKITTS